MAIEVAHQAYFSSKAKDSAQASCNESSEGSHFSSSYGQPRQFCKVFWANYIHDLESIWWIAVWVLYRFQKPEQKRKTPREIPKEGPWEPFLNLGSLTSRTGFFNFDMRFLKHIHSIPNPVLALKIFVLKCKQVLDTAYMAEETHMKMNSPIKMSEGCTIHKKILKLLRSARSKNDVSRIIPIDRKVVNIGTGSESKCNINEIEEIEDLIQNYEQQQVFAY